MTRILSFDRRAERAARATRQQLAAMQRSVDLCNRHLRRKREALKKSCRVLCFSTPTFPGANDDRLVPSV